MRFSEMYFFILTICDLYLYISLFINLYSFHKNPVNLGKKSPLNKLENFHIQLKLKFLNFLYYTNSCFDVI